MKISLFLLLLLFLPKPVLADANIAVPAEVKLGDKCVYEQFDGYSKALLYQLTNTVTAMDDKTITLTTERVYKDGSVRHGRLIIDRNLNTLELSSGKITPYYLEYYPYYQGFFFPLYPGKKVQEMEVKYPGRSGEVTATLGSKVSEWSNVKVAAGEFRVLKINRTGFYRHPGGSGTITDIISVSTATWCNIRREAKIGTIWIFRELASFTHQQ